MSNPIKQTRTARDGSPVEATEPAGIPQHPKALRCANHFAAIATDARHTATCTQDGVGMHSCCLVSDRPMSST